MLRKQINSLVIYEFPLFENLPVTHGCCTYHGGTGPYNLNFGLNTEDTPLKIEQNYSLLAKALSIPKPFIANQVHRTDHALITPTSPHISPDVDILLTNDPNCPLAIQHADCQAALFYDPKNHAIATAHAGWRGQTLDIYKITISLMHKYFSSNPSDILVAISPSLGPEHSEFLNYKTELPPHFHPYQTKLNHFNLWQIAKDQLLKEGILPNNLQIASICTKTHKEDFFSFRRERNTGRNLSFINLHS